MQHLAPKSLFAGRYEIIRVISTGGMGAVYEVLHLQTRRHRAMKVMLPARMADADMRERFTREATVTANVQSEHVVEIFDAGIDDASASPFIVMELLKGEDLGKRLERLGPRPAREVVQTLQQVGRALDKTHAEGIIHRDLKPENLFWTVRDDGSPKVKVLDFGIAKLLVAADMAGSTRPIGTPLYMAPEQVEGRSAKMGPVVDVYALGHIAYTLLTGRPYFADEAERTDSVLGLLTYVARGTTEPATERAARAGVTLPPAFDTWFRRATSLDAAERFSRAGELADALGQAFGATVVRAVSGDAARRDPDDDAPPQSVADSYSVTAPVASPPRVAARAAPRVPVAPTEADVSKGVSDVAPRSKIEAFELTAPPSVRTNDVALPAGPSTTGAAPVRRSIWLGLGAALLVGGAAALVLVNAGGDRPTSPSAEPAAGAKSGEPGSSEADGAGARGVDPTVVSPAIDVVPSGTPGATTTSDPVPAPTSTAGTRPRGTTTARPTAAASAPIPTATPTVVPSSTAKPWEKNRMPVP